MIKPAPKAEKLPGFREEGAIATNYEIATGAERYEFMSKLEGAEPWEEMKPIVISKKGTKAEPVVVSGMDPVRYVACSGMYRVFCMLRTFRIERKTYFSFLYRFPRRLSRSHLAHFKSWTQPMPGLRTSFLVQQDRRRTSLNS